MTDLRPGKHACLLYDTEDEQRTSTLSFLMRSIEDNHKCLYITDTYTSKTILRCLRDSRYNGDYNQVVVIPLQDTLLSGNSTPYEMIEFLKSETICALAEGHGALCAIIDMSWMAQTLNASDAARLIDYETCLNIFHPITYGRFTLCQYNMRLFDPKLMLNVLIRHPFVAVGAELCANPFYLSPSELSENDLPSILLARGLNEIKERKSVEDELMIYYKEIERLEEERKSHLCLGLEEPEAAKIDLQANQPGLPYQG